MESTAIREILVAIVVLIVSLTLTTACGTEGVPMESQLDDYEPQTVEQLECMPDLDGRIEADQLQPAFDLPVNYRISPANHERPVDLAGYQDQVTGERVWDLSSEDYELADQMLEFVATDIGEKWYADDFPGAEFTTVLDPATEIDAVYSHDSDALYLHGYASAHENPEIGQTLVVYDEPAVAYDFPIEKGDAWSQTAKVHDGLVRDLPYTAEEHYQFEVDASGELWLPDITFRNVLRVHTSVTIDAAIGHPVYREQVQFLFECFGEVARLVGPDAELEEGNEDEEYQFDTAVEMRRLGF